MVAYLPSECRETQDHRRSFQEIETQNGDDGGSYNHALVAYSCN